MPPPLTPAVLFEIVEAVTFNVPQSSSTPPPKPAVFPVTSAFCRFTTEPQKLLASIPPPSDVVDPFVIVRFRTVNVTSAVNFSTDPVAFPFNVAPGVPPWIVTDTGTVQFPTHGFGPNTVTVPPVLINACNPGVSIAATPVHVYEPDANADPTPNASTAVAATATTRSCASRLPGRRGNLTLSTELLSSLMDVSSRPPPVATGNPPVSR